jgi:hypothetical protein
MPVQKKKKKKPQSLSDHAPLRLVDDRPVADAALDQPQRALLATVALGQHARIQLPKQRNQRLGGCRNRPVARGLVGGKVRERVPVK